MAEESPYETERELENEVDEELLALLATALIFATSSLTISSFSRSEFQTIQDRFQTKSSEILPQLNSISQRSIQAGLDRISDELNINDLAVNYSDPRLQSYINRVFQDNIDEILDTNQRMWIRLQQIAIEKGWSEEELVRRLKKYYGLTPSHLQTVLNMESALNAENISKKIIEQQVQKRIDNLIEWRFRLTSGLIGTEIVEGSKELSWTILGETAQLDSESYLKQWVSVVDENTTNVCLSSHLTTAEIGGTFPNGFKYPPNLNVIHPCRSSMRIIRRN